MSARNVPYWVLMSVFALVALVFIYKFRNQKKPIPETFPRTLPPRGMAKNPSKKAHLQLRPDPSNYPTIAPSLTDQPDPVGLCTHLCEENGDCNSAAFHECTQRDTQAFGVRGRKRTAFTLDQKHRQVGYNMLVPPAF